MEKNRDQWEKTFITLTLSHLSPFSFHSLIFPLPCLSLTLAGGGSRSRRSQAGQAREREQGRASAKQGPGQASAHLRAWRGHDSRPARVCRCGPKPTRIQAWWGGGFRCVRAEGRRKRRGGSSGGGGNRQLAREHGRNKVQSML